MRIEETGHIGHAHPGACGEHPPHRAAHAHAHTPPPALVREADRCEVRSNEFVPEFWAMLDRENLRMAALRYAEYVERSAAERADVAAGPDRSRDASDGARPGYAGARIGDVNESAAARTVARVDAAYQRDVIASAGNIVNVLL